MGIIWVACWTHSEPPTVSPVDSEQGLETSLSTCTEPWIKGLSRPLKPLAASGRLHHHHVMGTNLSQIGCAPFHGDDFIETRKGEFHSCRCLGTIPLSRSLRAPCIPDQPPPLGRRHLFAGGSRAQIEQRPNPCRMNLRAVTPLGPSIPNLNLRHF